jgi:hypothetical protein
LARPPGCCPQAGGLWGVGVQAGAAFRPRLERLRRLRPAASRMPLRSCSGCRS